MSDEAYQKNETRDLETGLETLSWGFRLGAPKVGPRSNDPKLLSRTLTF